MFLRKLALYTFLSLCSLWAAAQTDNVFWFAAPDISHIHGNAPKNGAPIYLHVTAVLPTTVTISQPADPTFIPIVFALDELEHRTIQLDNIMSIDRIENYPQPITALPVNVQKKAFKITSDPGDITVYYELDNYYNRDIFPLKGKNGMGTDFFVSTQNHFPNGTTQYSNTTWSGFVVAATESPTRIVVYPNDDWLYFDTNPGDSIVLMLNAGETFVFRAASAAANRHINGVRVKSNKNIVITVYDDSMQKKHTNNINCSSNLSFDTFGDQIIPINLIGHEYIVMKGAVTVTNAPNCPADGGERVFITSTRPGNTLIYMNGILKGTLTGPGQIFNYQIDDTTVHLLATQPVYVNHVTGFGGELGGAVLPTIDGCTGSYNVSFTRTPNTNDAFLINVMARNDKILGSPTRNKTRESFTIFSNGVTTVIPSTYFNYFLDSSWVVLKKTPEVVAFIASKILPGNEARISNSVARFHLGIINGGTATGCKYGYFSDYRSDYANAGIGGANAQKSKTYCSYDPIHLVANGGKAYKWFGVLNPNDTAMLSSTTVADPYFTPDPIMHANVNEFQFGVRITQECFGADTLFLRVYVMAGPVALFEAATVEGCTPFNAVFTNLSDTVRAIENYWNFDTRYNTTVNQSALTNPFERAFPENYTDTIQEYTVRLTVKGAFHMCPNSREKIIKVKPGIKAGFMADNTVGCPPLLAHFNDTSVGYIDTLNSYWDFSVYQQSYTPSTSYSYQNNHLNDTTYLAKLIAFSRFGCVDTAEFPVHVFPHIIANFGVTNLAGCSPFSTNMNPLGSVGVDTFKWSIRDKQGSIIDSSFNRTNENAFDFYHNDSSQPNPDTLFVNLSGVNDFGCIDTAIPKRLIIYPEVHARFTTTENEVCDSTNVTFFNNSAGYNLIHEWNLGDGAFLVDTTENNIVHKYFNRTSNTKEFFVKLVTTSDFFCSDTLVDTITVYPFIKANFAIDYSNNCSPLNVQFTNTSKGGTDFNWNFGDGNIYNTLLPETLYHIYENNSDNDTTYYIHLTATNTQGCSDSIDRSVFLFPRVVADFDFNSPNQGCNPLNVSFVNNSKGQNLDFMWDFGDKTYSTSQYPPPRTYKNSTDKDTTYYVNLTVMNLAGCDSSVTKTVEVYSKVTADFSIERVDSCSPFKIRIDNFSSGGITDFIWKYTVNDSVILHDFSNPVIPFYHNKTLFPIKHPVVLYTRNTHNCSAAKYDTITVFPEMHAEFQADRISGCQPLPVNVVNNSNIKTGTSFFWDFGDGKYSNLVSPPNHIYSNLGNTTLSRTVILDATTQYGCFDDTTVTIDIFPYIYAKFTIDKPAICADELFAIDRNSSAGAINNYLWDFDDGSPVINKPDNEFQYTYPNNGITNLSPKIKLTVTNVQGCDTSWTESIAVHPQVRTAFSMDDNEVCYPLPTAFTNLSQPAILLTYYWDFGDGSSSLSKNPTHSYKNFSRTNTETFNIKLTATSEYGCDSTIIHSVAIHPKPMAAFDFPVAVDCPPFPVQFTNGSVGTSLDYHWNFSNGETSEDQNPLQTFDNQGSDILEYPVNLIVVSDYNCSDTAFKPVKVYPGVRVDFEASAWNGCHPMQINLNGTATNENEYYWYIDENVISNYEDPSYRFTNESATDKTFNVRFKAVSSNGCLDDTIKSIIIYPKPRAEFLPDPQAQDFNTETDITAVTFNNQTNNQSAWSYHWDYGDGTNSTQSAASFPKYYTIWGDIHNENRIPVSMIATNVSHPLCSDTTMHFVIIKPPLPKVELGPDVSGCVPLTVEFSSNTKYNYPDHYEWNFGFENQHSTAVEPGPMVYDTAGIYIVRLLVEGDGGTNWDYKTITVYSKPEAKFSFAPDSAWVRSQTEPGTPIMFLNLTDRAEQYIWDFDSDHTPDSYEFQPQHEYLAEGEYIITLTAENAEGCSDTYTTAPVKIMAHGELKFPNVITITPGSPANEYFDQDDYENTGIFRPVNIGVDKYKLEIYNRWGALIFESDDVNRGWNGFIKGSPVKQDVYVWRVTAIFTNGRPFVTGGDVTVLVKQP